MNDFDETLPAPFEWDVKRLAASLAVAGQVAKRLCQVYVLGTRSGCIQYPDLLDFQPSISA